MRPRTPPALNADVARGRMAPNGLVKPYSQSTIPRPAIRKVRKVERPLVALEEVMLLSADPSGNTWGTSGGAAAEPGDVALLVYAWPWQSSGGPNLDTPTGWTELGTWDFEQYTGSTVHSCLTVIYQTVTDTIAAGTYETTEAFPYFLNGSTYTGAGLGVVYRGNGLPVLDDAQTDLNTGRTAMLPAAGLGLQIAMGQTAVGAATGARLVTDPDSSSYLRSRGSGQTIRTIMTKIDAGGSTGPLDNTIDVFGETLRGGVYTEENYNYIRASIGWAA